MGLFDWFRSRGGDAPDAYDASGPVVLVIRDADGPVADGVEASGRKIARVAHGEARLRDRIAELRPSALVIGIESDGKNGFVVHRSVKADARMKRVPVVLFSREAGEDVFAQHRKLRSAADAYVLGAHPDDLVRALDELRGSPGSAPTDRR